MRIWVSYVEAASGNVPATPGTISLGDDEAGAMISGWLPSAGITAQEDKRLRAKSARFHDRGNRAWSHSFKTDRQHASVDHALRFLRDHPLKATRSGRLHVRIANRTVIYADAVVEEVAAIDHIGVSTVHQYRIRTGDPA